MRYRALDAARDYSFGSGRANMLQDSPAAVGQAVLTRLLLITGEWFYDVSEGTPYFTDVLGKGTLPLYEIALRERVLRTQGVTAIVAFSSSVINRKLAVEATIDTVYGRTKVTGALG